MRSLRKRSMSHSTACAKTSAAGDPCAGAHSARANSAGIAISRVERPGGQTKLRSPAVYMRYAADDKSATEVPPLRCATHAATRWKCRLYAGSR